MKTVLALLIAAICTCPSQFIIVPFSSSTTQPSLSLSILNSKFGLTKIKPSCVLCFPLYLKISFPGWKYHFPCYWAFFSWCLVHAGKVIFLTIQCPNQACQFSTHYYNLFLSLLVIILSQLNYFPILFKPRIYSRGRPSSSARLKLVYTCGLQCLHPRLLQLLLSVKEHQCLVGMIVSIILTNVSSVSVKWRSPIIYRFSIKISTLFVPLIKWPRVIDYKYWTSLLSTLNMHCIWLMTIA